MSATPTITISNQSPTQSEGWTPKKGTLAIVLVGVSGIALATGVLTLLVIKGAPLGSLNALSHLKTVGGWVFVGVGSGLTAVTLSMIIYITFKHYQQKGISSNPSHQAAGAFINAFGKPWNNPPTCNEVTWSNTSVVIGPEESSRVEPVQNSRLYKIDFLQDEQFDQEEKKYITSQIDIIEKLIPTAQLDNYNPAVIYNFDGSAFDTPFHAQFCQMQTIRGESYAVTISKDLIFSQNVNYLVAPEASKIKIFTQDFEENFRSDADYTRGIYFVWKTDAFHAVCTLKQAECVKITLYAIDDPALAKKVGSLEGELQTNVLNLIAKEPEFWLDPALYNYLFWQLKNGVGTYINGDKRQLLYKQNDKYYYVPFTCIYNLEAYVSTHHIQINPLLGLEKTISKQQKAYIYEYIQQNEPDFLETNFAKDKHKMTLFHGIYIYHVCEQDSFKLIYSVEPLPSRYPFENRV